MCICICVCYMSLYICMYSSYMYMYIMYIYIYIYTRIYVYIIIICVYCTYTIHIHDIICMYMYMIVYNRIICTIIKHQTSGIQSTCGCPVVGHSFHASHVWVAGDWVNLGHVPTRLSLKMHQQSQFMAIFFWGTWEKNGIGGLRGILRWFQTDTSDFFWGLGSDSINGYESSLASRPPKTHSDLGCPKSLRNCPCSTQGTIKGNHRKPMSFQW